VRASNKENRKYDNQIAQQQSFIPLLICVSMAVMMFSNAFQAMREPLRGVKIDVL